MDQGQPVQDLCPDGSYVIPYEDIQKSTYNKQVMVQNILSVQPSGCLVLMLPSAGELATISRTTCQWHRAAPANEQSDVPSLHAEQTSALIDVCAHSNSIVPNAQVGDDADIFFRGIDQSDPANQARMLQALNQTLHTPYVNATLSAFDNNWCALDENVRIQGSPLPDQTRCAFVLIRCFPVCCREAC